MLRIFILAICLFVLVIIIKFSIPYPLRDSSEEFAHRIDKAEFGRSSWTFLHGIANAYPDNPSESEQDEAMTFIDFISRNFPCLECAIHMREYIIHHPPLVASRSELVLWVFDFHNDVNERLGKVKYKWSDYSNRWSKLNKECEDCAISQII